MIRKSIVREIRRFGADRALMVLTVVVPVVLGLLFVLMFRGGRLTNLPIAICDQDQSSLSRTMRGMFDASPASFIAMETPDMLQAQKAMLSGQVMAIVLIPQGMQAKILGGEQAPVAAYINGAYITNSALLEQDIKTIFQSMNVAVQTETLTAQGMSPEQSYAMSYPIIMNNHILFNPWESYAYYLLPALLPLILIVVVGITTVYVLGSEFRYGTARDWLAAARGNTARALLGKLSPYFLLFCLVFVFLNTLLYRFMGLPFEAQSVGIMLTGSVLLIMSYMSIGVAMVALTSNLRLSMSLMGAYTVAAFSAAGITFPMIGMYEPIRWMAHLFPFTYYMDLFIDQSMRGAPAARSLGDLAALGGFVIFGLLFVGMLGRKARSSKYFGKL